MEDIDHLPYYPLYFRDLLFGIAVAYFIIHTAVLAGESSYCRGCGFP